MPFIINIFYRVSKSRQFSVLTYRFPIKCKNTVHQGVYLKMIIKVEILLVYEKRDANCWHNTVSFVSRLLMN